MKTALLLTALLFAGCSSMPSGSGEPINTTCPVSDEPIGANAPTVAFEGHTIALCCGGCEDDWNAMSDQAKHAKVERMLAAR